MHYIEIYLALFLISFVIMYLGRKLENTYVDVIFKIICSLLLVIVSIYVRNFYPLSYFTMLIPIGMLCGFFGDFFLGIRRLPNLSSHKKLVSFGLGVLAFLAGHIVYIISFSNFYKLSSEQLISIALLSFVTLYVVSVKKDSFKFDNKIVKIVSYIYGYVVTFVMLVTLAIAASYNVKSSFILFTSGVIFFLSDLLLLFIYFGKKEKSKKKYLFYNMINLSTYYLAQIGFILLPLYYASLK